ncbi:unnamed protein product, partial [Tetraodon nigroviridis]
MFPAERLTFDLWSSPTPLTQTPVLPPTITDQIRLWELERDRLQFTEGVLYNQFLSQTDFEVLRDRAQVGLFHCCYTIRQKVHQQLSPVLQSLGCLLWQDAAHRVMVVTLWGHSEVKKFWKRQK